MLRRFTLCLLSLLIPVSAAAEVISVSPEQNWCDVANAAAPGDVVALEGGDHTSACFLGARGEADAPIVIRSADPSDPARMAYDGTTANVIDIREESAHLVIENLYFSTTQQGVDAIKIRGGHDFEIRDNLFAFVGGVSIAANTGHTERITITGNVFFDLQSTGIYLGCHEGAISCRSTQALIEGNTIFGVNSTGVGYGIQIKVDSDAVIRDNSIFDTQGPGVMVYGARGNIPPSIIDGNLIIGSRRSGPILVGGGPATVTNNIVARGWWGGIVSYSHDAGGPQQGVIIAHNTAFENEEAGIRVQDWEVGSSNFLVNNAVIPLPDHAAFSPAYPGGSSFGNVECTNSWNCVVDVENTPFSVSPLVDGHLIGAATAVNADWYPRVDFMGRARSTSPTAGAIERALEDGGPWLQIDQSRPPRLTDDPELPPDENGDEEPIEEVGEEVEEDRDDEDDAVEESHGGDSDSQIESEPPDALASDSDRATSPQGESSSCGAVNRSDGVPGAVLLLAVLLLAARYRRVQSSIASS